MASVTISVSILEGDLPSLNHLVEVFARGNRSAFLQIAMRQMEILERAERLDALSAYGDVQLAAKALTVDDIPDVVHRVLSKEPVTQMPVMERADRWRDLQAFGVQQRTALGIDEANVNCVVHRVLAKQRKA